MPTLSYVYPWPAQDRADRPTDEDPVADVAIRGCRSIAELYSEALAPLGRRQAPRIAVRAAMRRTQLAPRVLPAALSGAATVGADVRGRPVTVRGLPGSRAPRLLAPLAAASLLLGGCATSTTALTQQMVDELVDVQHDDAVAEYRREAYPVLASVGLTLAPAGFSEVVRVADRYRDADDIDLLEVASGNFLLIRDRVNEDLRVTAAREEVVHMVDLRFQLRGAVVSGRGPLELTVHPSDEVAVRQLVERTDLGLAGNVIVRASGQNPS